MKQEKKKWSQAMTFIVLFGIVSLFSDMTHEGASSIRGAYLSLLGASAGMIGFVSGLGELVGYSMRYVFGKLTDKTKRYWPMTIFGYLLDILAVPALALVGEHGWMWACALPCSLPACAYSESHPLLGFGTSLPIDMARQRRLSW